MLCAAERANQCVRARTIGRQTRGQAQIAKSLGQTAEEPCATRTRVKSSRRFLERAPLDQGEEGEASVDQAACRRGTTFPSALIATRGPLAARRSPVFRSEVVTAGEAAWSCRC